MKNKTTAALIALLLGGIGGHRFYLGQVGKGLLYLFFCWTFIPAFVAFIDAIIFFTMSDNDFNFKYNREYTGNFQAGQPMVVINNNIGQPNHNNPIPFNNNSHQEKEENKSRPKKDPFELEGDRKYADYDFDGAMEQYLKSLNVKPNNSKVHFNLSCLYSILEKTKISLFHLSKAIEQGYYDFDKIDNHDHLSFLRTQQEFLNFKNNGYKLTEAIEPPKTTGLDLSDSVISQIERLAKLKDSGIISEDDFLKQKDKLFNQ